jgi:6-pyruvoyltetrahydropterin/6-carboxytetrahydropterin synthase
MTNVVYGSTKKWVYRTSTAFRQWKSDSHCKFVHGYDLQFKASFEASHLDGTNWVVDFGGLKPFLKWIEEMFDHTTLVANDDPMLAKFTEMHAAGAMDVRVVEATGCEAMAKMCFDKMDKWLKDNGYFPRVRLVRFDVCENEVNSAYVRLKNSNHPDFIGWDKASS